MSIIIKTEQDFMLLLSLMSLSFREVEKSAPLLEAYSLFSIHFEDV